MYANTPWSECDPLTMLRSKTVHIKTDLSQTQNVTLQQQQQQQQHCPLTRELTKDCTMEELPEGLLFVYLNIFLKITN